MKIAFQKIDFGTIHERSSKKERIKHEFSLLLSKNLTCFVTDI
jgi:hypothetical protein